MANYAANVSIWWCHHEKFTNHEEEIPHNFTHISFSCRIALGRGYWGRLYVLSKRFDRIIWKFWEFYEQFLFCYNFLSSSIKLQQVTAEALTISVAPTIRDPFYQYGLTLIPAWISGYIRHTVWDENTHPFPNFNGCSVAVWEWISCFILHCIINVISYSRWKIQTGLLPNAGYWMFHATTSPIIIATRDDPVV